MTDKVRKTRVKTELPSSIDNGEGEPVELKDVTLGGLEEAMNQRKEWLSIFDNEAVKRTELELKAIKSEIRKRAK